MIMGLMIMVINVLYHYNHDYYYGLYHYTWCLAGNGWEWGNGIIIDCYYGSFPHSL